jgi:two-component system sensor histidine kinase ChvG
MAVVVAVVLMPLALVAVTGVEERRVGGRLAESVRAGAEEAAAEPSELDGIARRLDLRIRVLDPHGATLAEADHEAGGNPLAAVGALFFGNDGAPSPRAFDESLGPLEERPEVRGASVGADVQVECRTSTGSKLLSCSAARRVAGPGPARLVYAQASSRRAVRALYDLRYEVSKLVVILLPVGILLAWWLGWRTVRPIEQLRAQVVASAAGRLTGARLELARSDEIGDLAAAFNGLLRALDERRQANEAFVADLVHEFKNPVAAIRACAEQLGAGATNSRTDRLVGVLEQSSGRLDALVSQFLELARAEAGMPTEPRAPVDLAALARGVLESERTDVRWGGVRFALREGPGARSASAPAVSVRIETALRNLVENAASFAAPDGEVEVVLDATDEVVSVSVRDTGPGIAEADLPRVFDRFFTTRGRTIGTGLGLALVKAMIVAHGGEVRAESTPGRGATFHVTLPKDGQS